MRKLWIWLGLVVIGIGAALYFGRSNVQRGASNRPWPLGLGVPADAPKRYPVVKDNAAAAKLIELASDAGVELQRSRERRGQWNNVRQELLDHLRVQLERSGDAIDAPPPDVARHLTKNAEVLDQIQALALSGQPIVFEADINTNPNEGGAGLDILSLQHLHRVFVARALDRARGEDAAAWNDLRTTWELVRPLWGRPDPTAVVAASTGARMVNAAARKMPLPPPPWFGEVATFRYERALASALQTNVWRSKAAAGALNERLRNMAEEVLRVRACDRTSPQFEAARERLGARATPSLMSMWERLMRFRAEREATERVLQIRGGQPPSPRSQCSDGSWKVTPTSFEFTREAPVERPQFHYPLKYAK